MTRWNEKDWEQELKDNPGILKLNPALKRELRDPEFANLDIFAELRAEKAMTFVSRPPSSILVSATPSKYRNRRTEYNGMLYASKKEAQKAFDLDLLKAAGEITFWLRQVNFPLLGKMVYRADFVTFAVIGYTQGGITWIVKVIEVKGYQTEAWKLKRKLFAETYPNLELEVI